MPLVTCPDCGKQVSDAAPACVGCGRPMDGISASTTRSALVAAGQEDSWRCPQCGGSEFKKFSLLYDENRSVLNSKTKALGVGYGPGGLGVGVGGATTSGVSMSDLAKRVAPPNRAEMAKNDDSVALGMIVAFVIAFLVYATVSLGWAVIAFVVSAFGAALVLGLRQAPAVETRYKAAFSKWSNSYLCLRCGATVSRTAEGRLQGMPQESPELDSLIRSGRKIQAIKWVVEHKGLSLADAKWAVEEREEEIRI